MSSLKAEKERFERNKVIYESALLSFKGVDGWDVYNCSVPFTYKGEVHLYGRVEKRSEWANSHVRLFVRTGKDEYTVVPDVIFQLEDPYVSTVKQEMIFGGTHVQKMTGQIKTYFGYFYHGSPACLTYFTTGPDSMKDIRVVELRGGKIGVFSRPRTGNAASIGFTIISNINELSETVIAGATAIPVLQEGTWGGVNQPYLLSNGKIGCIAHASYEDNTPQGILKVYVNYSFVLDPVALRVEDAHIIGTKSCYPEAPAKVPDLIDCVFTSGIVMRRDGKCDLYSGVGDTNQGRITIDNPFRGQGTILSDLTFNPPFAKL